MDCPACNTPRSIQAFEIDDPDNGRSRRRLRCTHCGHSWHTSWQQSLAPSAVRPGPADHAAARHNLGVLGVSLGMAALVLITIVVVLDQAQVHVLASPLTGSVAIGGCAAIVIFRMLWGWVFRCPACGRLDVRQATGEHLVRKRSKQEIRMRSVAAGEEREITWATLCYDYECPHCDYQWDRIVERKYDSGWQQRF